MTDRFDYFVVFAEMRTGSNFLEANINAFDNNFGGIFIVKKLGPKHHRIVFTTELGNKIFDFTFKEDSFKVNQILKELDKKLLINILKSDFKTLIMENPPL